ncbi:MAG: response regulator [Chitinophagaceae bacterium]|nr:MAG: response regulator [Chitinophagaceae bacterium]
MMASISTKEISVLIVDDNKFFAQRMAGMLDEMENVWNIQKAHSHDEAVHLLTMHRYDYMLVDINMPGKSGISLLKTIRLAGFSGNIIMLTNSSEEFYRERCMQLGASHFLDKTSDFEKVPLILNGIL